MTDGDDNTDVYEAFEAAIEYFHGQLDATIPDHIGTCSHEECLVIDEDECTRPVTGREYFENRGWSAETIDEWKLGYAPGGGGLAAALREQGFSDDTLHATGLFTKNLTALWRGRYVLPYFDTDGRPVYAIARTAGKKGGGAAGYDGHPEDFLAGKYAKVAHTKDHVPLSEPIFGRSTLDGSEDIIIAEGIADAITAAAAGHSVLSPVTTQFKQEHFDELLQLVSGAANRVFVVPDSERAGFSRIDSDDIPDEPGHIYEAINLPKVSPGLGGALRTANYLCEHDIDARVVELPRSGLRKVDLDDYLNDGWADDLDAVLRSAQPPGQHSDFTAATEGQVTEEEDNEFQDEPGIPEDRPDTDSDLGASRRDGGSALWDLSLAEVNEDLGAGSRSKNPLGHIGDSQNYFHVFRPEDDADLLAVDYKRKVKYNGLTYLLVEEEARDVTSPGGSLSPEETWVAWSAARERGLLGPDDTIPAAALRYIATDRALYDFDALPDDSDALPSKAHNAALAWVANEWWDDDETEATDRRYKARDPESALTWEDVRYIYEEGKDVGRYAAERLLRSRYDFMAVAGSETLQMYDPATGTYDTQLSPLLGEIHEGLGVHWSTHELMEIKARLRQQDIVEPRELNARLEFDNPHICVENGVLDLFERELKSHSPEYHFTERIPVTRDPDASTEPYEDFLDDLTSRPEDAKAMMEMVGHALIPDSNERYKKFMILHGGADNGKTEFHNRVTDLLEGPDGEEQNVSNVKLQKIASNRFSMDSIYGHMANIAGEIDGKKIRNTAALKDIPGGDKTEIEPKGEQSIFDAVNATLMFAANDPPIIGERDKQAIASRIVPVELPYTFVDEPTDEWEKQKIPSRELDEMLSTDEAMSGFLNLALDGIERLEANHDVSLPETDMERLQMYETQADSMKEFAHECLENHESDYIVKADVTAIFKEFAATNGYEIGSNVNDTLHSVIKGIQALNPADGRPRTPDYVDTELPLRPWDERKMVMKRVSLTETGLKHARSAGLVVDSHDESAAEVDESGVRSIESLAPGDGYVDVRATVSGILDPPEWLAGEGSMEDETGEVDYKVRAAATDTELAIALNEGTQYRIENAKVTTDEGALVLELREGRTNLVRLGEIDRDDDQQSMTAVADGGEQTVDATDEETQPSDCDGDEATSDDTEAPAVTDDDREGVTANASRILEIMREADSETVDRAMLGVLTDDEMSAEDCQAALDKLRERGDIIEEQRGHYRPA